MEDTANSKETQDSNVGGECSRLDGKDRAKIDDFDFSFFLAFGHWRL